MTPRQWYDKKRKEYQERYGTEWIYLYVWPPAGEEQNLEVCEKALRIGIECRFLKPDGPTEIEIVANAAMIRDYLAKQSNVPYEAFHSRPWRTRTMTM